MEDPYDSDHFCDEDDEDEYYYESDEWDEAISNCGGFFDQGYFMCLSAGSEPCEFECPFNHQIGKTEKELDEELFE